MGEAHVAACLHPGAEEGDDAFTNATAGTVAAGHSAHEPPPTADTGQELLEVDGATKEYPALGGSIVRRQGGVISAVSDVSFTVRPGETFGLVGESGCGKSTLGRLVAMLETPTSGALRLDGAAITGLTGAAGCGKCTLGGVVAMREVPTSGALRLDSADISGVTGRESRAAHRRIQMMFQDSTAAMDPRMRIDEILTEPLDIQKVGTSRSRAEQVEDLVGDVGLADDALERYPHEFSGGQLQRVGLARSLALGPRLVVCDEPVSALDVSVQAQV